MRSHWSGLNALATSGLLWALLPACAAQPRKLLTTRKLLTRRRVNHKGFSHPTNCNGIISIMGTCSPWAPAAWDASKGWYSGGYAGYCGCSGNQIETLQHVDQLVCGFDPCDADAKQWTYHSGYMDYGSLASKIAVCMHHCETQIGPSCHGFRLNNRDDYACVFFDGPCDGTHDNGNTGMSGSNCAYNNYHLWYAFKTIPPPTASPTTGAPSVSPSYPTLTPSVSPSHPTLAPSLSPTFTHFFLDSKMLTDYADQVWLNERVKTLRPLTSETQYWGLCYSKERDGGDLDLLMDQCSNKGAMVMMTETVQIIKAHHWWSLSRAEATRVPSISPTTPMPTPAPTFAPTSPTTAMPTMGGLSDAMHWWPLDEDGGVTATDHGTTSPLTLNRFQAYGYSHFLLTGSFLRLTQYQAGLISGNPTTINGYPWYPPDTYDLALDPLVDTHGFTAAFWYRRTPDSGEHGWSSDKYMFHMRSEDQENGLAFWVNSNTQEWSYGWRSPSSTPGTPIVGDFVFADSDSTDQTLNLFEFFDSWNHFAVTVDQPGGADALKMYVNGVLCHTSTGYAPLSTQMYRIALGINSLAYAHSNGAAGYWADVRLYATAHTPAAVATIATAAWLPPTPSPSYWKYPSESPTTSPTDATATPTEVPTAAPTYVYLNPHVSPNPGSLRHRWVLSQYPSSGQGGTTVPNIGQEWSVEGEIVGHPPTANNNWKGVRFGLYDGRYAMGNFYMGHDVCCNDVDGHDYGGTWHGYDGWMRVPPFAIGTEASGFTITFHMMYAPEQGGARPCRFGGILNYGDLVVRMGTTTGDHYGTIYCGKSIVSYGADAWGPVDTSNLGLSGTTTGTWNFYGVSVRKDAQDFYFRGNSPTATTVGSLGVPHELLIPFSIPSSMAYNSYEVDRPIKAAFFDVRVYSVWMTSAQMDEIEVAFSDAPTASPSLSPIPTVHPTTKSPTPYPSPPPPMPYVHWALDDAVGTTTVTSTGSSSLEMNVNPEAWFLDEEGGLCPHADMTAQHAGLLLFGTCCSYVTSGGCAMCHNQWPYNHPAGYHQLHTTTGNDLTFAAYVYRTGSGGMYFMAKRMGSDGTDMKLGTTYWAYWVRYYTSTYNYFGPDPVPMNEWSHLAVTVSSDGLSGYVKIYINGLLHTSFAPDHCCFSTTKAYDQIVFGNSNSRCLRDVRLYSEALTETQIADYWGTPTAAPSASPSTPTPQPSFSPSDSPSTPTPAPTKRPTKSPTTASSILNLDFGTKTDAPIASYLFGNTQWLPNENGLELLDNTASVRLAGSHTDNVVSCTGSYNVGSGASECGANGVNMNMADGWTMTLWVRMHKDGANLGSGTFIGMKSQGRASGTNYKAGGEADFFIKQNGLDLIFESFHCRGAAGYYVPYNVCNSQSGDYKDSGTFTDFFEEEDFDGTWVHLGFTYGGGVSEHGGFDVAGWHMNAWECSNSFCTFLITSSLDNPTKALKVYRNGVLRGTQVLQYGRTSNVWDYQAIFIGTYQPWPQSTSGSLTSNAFANGLSLRDVKMWEADMSGAIADLYVGKARVTTHWGSFVTDPYSGGWSNTNSEGCMLFKPDVHSVVTQSCAVYTGSSSMIQFGQGGSDYGRLNEDLRDGICKINTCGVAGMPIDGVNLLEVWYAGPTAAPTGPTLQPTLVPSDSPTSTPSARPTTGYPTRSPTKFPTQFPSTGLPTKSPSPPSPAPTARPTASPTPVPTWSPTSLSDCGGHPRCLALGFPAGIRCCPNMVGRFMPCCDNTAVPTRAPTVLTQQPTTAASPTSAPTYVPTADPTPSPSFTPSTATPSKAPTPYPSARPTRLPSVSPSTAPSQSPSSPTYVPTEMPSAPTAAPTEAVIPTHVPTTAAPTVSPTASPTTKQPTDAPSFAPTTRPSPPPSFFPTPKPTSSPSSFGDCSMHPRCVDEGFALLAGGQCCPNPVSGYFSCCDNTVQPTMIPSVSPSFSPSPAPSASPSIVPSASPTASPTGSPTMETAIVNSAEGGMVFSSTRRRLRARRGQQSTPWYHLPEVHDALKAAFAEDLGGGATAADVTIICFDTVAICGAVRRRRRLQHVDDIVAKMAAIWETKKTYSPTTLPSVSPTKVPTLAPTGNTSAPTASQNATLAPTKAPSGAPTTSPSKSPTASPTLHMQSLAHLVVISVQAACGNDCAGLEVEVDEFVESSHDINKEQCLTDFVTSGNCTLSERKQREAIAALQDDYCYLVEPYILRRCREACLFGLVYTGECENAWNGRYDLDAEPECTVADPSNCTCVDRFDEVGNVFDDVMQMHGVNNCSTALDTLLNGTLSCYSDLGVLHESLTHVTLDTYCCATCLNNDVCHEQQCVYPPRNCAGGNRTFAALSGARAFCAAHSPAPSTSPTVSPSPAPSTSPTFLPSASPTPYPTPEPTRDPCRGCRRNKATGYIDRLRGSRYCDPLQCQSTCTANPPT